ncbi:hypothetical protein SAMN04488587_1810 [Methanococcoides vulcani]|uniref:Uncharacterized protein n=1 Tax=Methanococcoides vulcani TaxID=1353158 RepID=A0A1I0ATC9_9EURY|nr:hypothetical protein [Methanococcoides vulcani]SES97612.1 hypothetical protein SAMN04488587_1810 [Methanococcoides vulcani]
MITEKDKGQEQKQKQEMLDDEELDDLMIKTAKSQIRSDYRRSLGCENSRRCMDLKMNKKDE